GVALYPFHRFNLTWVPQQLWQPRVMPFGVWTVCLHPNTMTDVDINRLKNFLATNHASCRDVDLTPRQSPWNPIFRTVWYSSLHHPGLRPPLLHKEGKTANYLDNHFTYTDPAAYDERATKPLEHFTHSLWEPILRHALTTHVSPGSTICDLGCGTLEHTQHMGAATQIYAVDNNQAMLAFGQ